MKRYVDFTCLWEKVPNGLLYDWLKFSEENGQRLKKLLAKCPSERPLDEWRFLSQEASRKLWPMWTDINWNGSTQSERDCFMNDLAEKGKHRWSVLPPICNGQTVKESEDCSFLYLSYNLTRWPLKVKDWTQKV